MCSLLAENPSIVAGKRLLGLGCGSAGICSMAGVLSNVFLDTMYCFLAMFVGCHFVIFSFGRSISRGSS
jgi:hypothetical protein